MRNILGSFTVFTVVPLEEYTFNVVSIGNFLKRETYLV